MVTKARRHQYKPDPQASESSAHIRSVSDGHTFRSRRCVDNSFACASGWSFPTPKLVPRAWILAIVACALLLITNTGEAQKQTAVVNVATVNDQPISLATVEHVLSRTLNRLPSQSSSASPDSSGTVEHDEAAIKAGIEHCINREVVFQHLQKGSFATSPRETNQLLDDWKEELKSTGQTLKVFLEQSKLSETEFRHELAWRNSWRKYATKFVDEAHLEKQFRLRQPQLDGTQLHVAQILWKSTTPETLAKSNRVRTDLVNRKTQWAAAVKAHSESASAKNGGDLGWIKFAGPMPRDFNLVAFELKAGEFSKPLVSRFGTHLIHCIEVKPGSGTFEDVAAELREEETKRLFELVAKRHRSTAKVNLTESFDATKE